MVVIASARLSPVTTPRPPGPAAPAGYSRTALPTDLWRTKVAAYSTAA